MKITINQAHQTFAGSKIVAVRQDNNSGDVIIITDGDVHLCISGPTGDYCEPPLSEVETEDIKGL